MQTIYLDNNATTPIDPEVAEAIAECRDRHFANPSSQHALGRAALAKLEEARDGIAAILGAELCGPQADRVILTSGGTEANNLAMLGLAGRRAGHVVVSAIEHASVLEAAAELELRDWRVSLLPVNSDGVVEHERLPSLVDDETRLVSVMLANNDSGVLQPVAELAAYCRQAGVAFHSDAVQVAGKLEIDFRGLDVTTLAISGHKFHGPRGVGVLLVRGDAQLERHLFGGPQQFGLRPGTEAVALAVGLHKALVNWQREGVRRNQHVRALQRRFESALLANWPGATVNGSAARRLPHTSNIAFVGLDRQTLFMLLDIAGVACSTGSACASGSSEPSPTLKAMGLDGALLSGSLRFSFSPFVTLSEVDQAVARILIACNDLRSRSGARNLASGGRGDRAHSV